ncbi:MAG: hypothetical protein U9N52_12090 [Campylobacterota bacterium]|nr:hypothetical protein [Campylobacterota bacterium]
MKKVIVGVLVATGLFGALFEQGSKNVGVTMGAGSSYGSNYTIIGVNASYFLMDNLMTGLEYRGWFGGDPMINEISVPVTYIVPIHEKFRPYAGAFVRRTFFDNSHYDNYNVYGARVGVSMITSGNSYASFGWVQEYYDRDCGILDCDTSSGYPEIAVGLSF